MGAESNIFQSFPWYTDPKYLNYKKVQCQKECAYKLITAGNALPPFQILRKPPTGAPVTTLKICCADGSDCTIIDFEDAENDRFFDIFEDECGREFITYNGAAFPFTLPCGFHIGILSDGTNTWFSEMFFVPDNAGSILPICYLTDHLYNLITTHDTSEPLETC